ncbi:MAG: T9SS type A sorting domain-containing protein [Chitinophagales bacterium]|nr:T9SS type A sorting domain-containing protein [Chitinophagales bacterium]
MQGAAQAELLFTLVNPLGQMIRQDFVPFNSGVLHQVFDYGSLPSGLYTLQISGGQKTYAVKVNIQRQ